MTPRKLASIKKALDAKHAEVLASGPAKIEPNRSDAAQAGVADEDAQALSEMLQTLSSERNRQKAQLLSQIDRALRRLEQSPDEFGTCEDCEEEIPDKRLKVMPYATLCAECQGKRDPRRGVTRKSITDYKK